MGLRVELVVVHRDDGAGAVDHVRLAAAEQAEDVLLDADLRVVGAKYVVVAAEELCSSHGHRFFTFIFLLLYLLTIITFVL